MSRINITHHNSLYFEILNNSFPLLYGTSKQPTVSITSVLFKQSWRVRKIEINRWRWEDFPGRILHHDFVCHTCRRDCHVSISLLNHLTLQPLSLSQTAQNMIPSFNKEGPSIISGDKKDVYLPHKNYEEVAEYFEWNLRKTEWYSIWNLVGTKTDILVQY